MYPSLTDSFIPAFLRRIPAAVLLLPLQILSYLQVIKKRKEEFLAEQKRSRSKGKGAAGLNNGNGIHANRNGVHTNGNGVHSSGNEVNTNGNGVYANENEDQTNRNRGHGNEIEVHTNGNEVHTNGNQVRSNGNGVHDNGDDKLNGSPNSLSRTQSEQLAAKVNAASGFTDTDEDETIYGRCHAVPWLLERYNVASCEATL